jgi:hypothetical protein
MSNEKLKAIQFTIDSRVFVRSLSDAYVCTRQIAQMNVDKALYFFNLSVLLDSLKNKDLFLAKFCEHDLCNVNIIACSNIYSFEKYFYMKFAVNLFLRYYNGIKTKEDYYEMSKELDRVYINLREDLNNYVGFIKRRNELVTKI